MGAEEDRQFERGLGLLEAWLLAHPGQQPGVADWVGRWLEDQEEGARRGLLPADRRARIEALGVRLPARDPAAVEAAESQAQAQAAQAQPEAHAAELQAKEASAAETEEAEEAGAESAPEAEETSAAVAAGSSAVEAVKAGDTTEGEAPRAARGALAPVERAISATGTPLGRTRWGGPRSSHRQEPTGSAQVPIHWQTQFLHLARLLRTDEPPTPELQDWLMNQERDLRRSRLTSEQYQLLAQLLVVVGNNALLTRLKAVRTRAVSAEPGQPPKTRKNRPARGARAKLPPPSRRAGLGSRTQAATPSRGGQRSRGSSSPRTPARTGARPRAPRVDPAAVRLQELERAGVPPDTLAEWVRSGRLLPTRAEGVFLRTRGLSEEIAALIRKAAQGPDEP